MSKDKRVFLGHVAFTFRNGQNSTDITLQAKMEIVRLTTGTTERPGEKWRITATHSAFDATDKQLAHSISEAPPVVNECVVDMDAGADVWCAVLEQLLLPRKYLESCAGMLNDTGARGSYKRGRIWEEKV